MTGKGSVPLSSNKNESGSYMGFANLPNQVHRKFVKKGFEFTLMVVGESGLGKTTLIDSLFLINLNDETKTATKIKEKESEQQTVDIKSSTVDIEERGVKLKLTVVDTPGFGDSINCEDCVQPIIKHIDEQYARFLDDESGLNRRNISDHRVHCCFYFISPWGRGLKPLDIECMRALQGKVNIVPIIAKADTLTHAECMRLKKQILKELSYAKIKIYQIPDCDSDSEEEDEFNAQNKVLRESIPFAVVGSNQVIEVRGKKVRGRLYPWGVVEVENIEHNDFVKLRTMLVTHMQDFQEVTHEVHYENYRAEQLGARAAKMQSRSGHSHSTSSADSTDSSSLTISSLRNHPLQHNSSNGTSCYSDEINSKDAILAEKEEELRKMQEMVAKMQAQMMSQSGQTVVGNLAN